MIQVVEHTVDHNHTHPRLYSQAEMQKAEMCLRPLKTRRGGGGSDEGRTQEDWTCEDTEWVQLLQRAIVTSWHLRKMFEPAGSIILKAMKSEIVREALRRRAALVLHAGH